MYLGIIILIIVVFFLLVYLIKIKKDIRKISNQIKMSQGEYANLTSYTIDRDIEELVIQINRLYDTSQQVRAQSKQNEEEIRSGIVNMSHDLRTPLTSIMGYIQLIKEPEIPEDEKVDYIEIIEKRTKNLQTLISSFYDLSQYQSGEFKFDLKPVNLSIVLCDNLALYYQEFTHKGIEPSIKIDENFPMIISDVKAVHRIYSNLIGNMIKYGQGKIEISLIQKDNLIVSKFINGAPQVTEKDLAHLFDRFYTGDQSRTAQNTGLGLAITKTLVERLGHEIDAQLEGENLVITIKWRTLC